MTVTEAFSMPDSGDPNKAVIRTPIGKFDPSKMSAAAVRSVARIFGGGEGVWGESTPASTANGVVTQLWTDRERVLLETHSTGSITKFNAFDDERMNDILVGVDATKLAQLKSRVGSNGTTYIRYSQLAGVGEDRHTIPDTTWSNPIPVAAVNTHEYNQAYMRDYTQKTVFGVAVQGAKVNADVTSVESIVMGCLDGGGNFVPASTHVLDMVEPAEFIDRYPQIPTCNLPGISS